MPELPDLSNYIESLKPRILAQEINGNHIDWRRIYQVTFVIQLFTPFVDAIDLLFGF